jgi:hypothetical protein
MARPSHPTPRNRSKAPQIYGHSWRFDGLSDLPSPFRTKWAFGCVPEAIRQQMMTHPKVYQSINNLKSAILGSGGRAVACVPPHDPRFEVAREYAEFCSWALRSINGSWHASARQILDAVHECHKIAFVPLREQMSGKYRGYWTLDTLNVLPNHTYRFLRDGAGNIVKLRVRDNGVWNEYDREDFCIFSYRPIDGHVWGTDVLYPVYEPYYRDVQCDPEEMAMVAQFGRPSNIWIAPGMDAAGNAPEDIPQFEADGVTPEIDPETNEQKKLPVMQAIANAVTNIAAGTNAVVPPGTTHKLVEAQNGAAMFGALREANARQIAAGILGTHQLTESETSKSKDNSAAAEGTVGLGVTDGKTALEQMVENDLFTSLIRYNYGEAALDLLPIFDLGSGQNGRMVALMNSIGVLVNGGAYDEGQWWYTCLDTGLPMPYPGMAKVVVSQPRPGGGPPGNTAD